MGFNSSARFRSFAPAGSGDDGEALVAEIICDELARGLIIIDD